MNRGTTIRVAVASLLLGWWCLVLFKVPSGSRPIQDAPARGSVADEQKNRPSGLKPDAGRPSRPLALSRLPPDVVRDYGYNAAHLSNGVGAPFYPSDARYARFVERLRQFPPEVLIVGKEAPFTHSLGPIPSFGGENRTFPLPPQLKKEDPRRLLSPDELKLKIKAIERFVADVHAAGVRTVVPYISPMTALGDAEKRLGLFQFYDRWDEYARDFKLGARPAGDPLEWTQRDARGNIYFRIGGGREEAGGMTRYSMCVNHPGWRRWQMIVAEWSARVGYDGVFMDNVLVHRCYDRHCEALGKSLGLDLHREPNRVWLESYLRYFDDLREAGRRPGSDFFLGGNYPELPSQAAVTDRLDLSMVEQVWLGPPRLFWPNGIRTGFYLALPDRRILSNRTRGTNEESALNNIWLAQLAYAGRGERGTHLLSVMPAGKTPDLAHNDDSALLALAEGATFGGGVAAQVTGQYPFHSDEDLAAHRARKRFFAFIRAHRELYEALLPAGDIALLVSPDGETAALMEAQQVHAALLWRGLLVDVLDADRQSPATLSKYKLLIAPGRPELHGGAGLPPLLTSPDPLRPEEVREAARGFRRGSDAPRLRQTKLGALAVERAAELGALALPLGALVQGNAWADERRMVLHLLNFRVPIGLGNGGRSAGVGSLPVRLRLPAGRRARHVMLHSPDAADRRTLPFKQAGDAVEFQVPSPAVYAVCEVVFARPD
jgi:hypothetical protein